MALIIKKTARFIAQLFLATCAVVVSLVIILQIGLIIAINMLYTGAGSSFLQGKINDALAASGYSVSFERLYYDPVRGLTLYDVSVMDSEGIFLNSNRFSLAVSFAQIPMRSLELTGSGGTLIWTRMPISANPNEDAKADIQPFSVPNMYFRTASIEHMSFKSVVVGEEIAGKSYFLSPSLQARIHFDDQIHLSMKFIPGMGALATGVPAPQRIEIDMSIEPQSLDIILDNLKVSSSAYSLESKGTANLSEHGVLHIVTRVEYTELGALTQGNFKSANIDFVINGPRNQPVLNATGHITPGRLGDHGLTDIALTLNAAEITQGFFDIQTTFRGESVKIDGNLIYEEPFLTVEKLNGVAPHATMSGMARYSTQTHHVDGTIAGAVSNLSYYQDVAGINLSGSLKADIALKSEGNEQAVDILASIQNGAYAEITAESISLKTGMTWPSMIWPRSLNLDATGIKISDNLKIKSLSALLTKTEEDQYRLSLGGNTVMPTQTSFAGTAIFSNLAQKIPVMRDADFTIKTGQSTLNLSGHASPEAIDLSLVAENVYGRDIPVSLPGLASEMRMSGNVTMTGPPESPHTELNVRFSGIGIEEYDDLVLRTTARHDGQAVTAQLTGQGSGIRELASSLQFPMTLSLVPFDLGLDMNASVTGDMKAALNLAALSPAFLPPTQALSGDIAIDAKISGSLQTPDLVGALLLSDANFADRKNGIDLADLNADMRFTKNNILLKSLSATDGKNGIMTGKGNLSLEAGSRADIHIMLSDFNIPKTELADGLINADLSLSRSVGLTELVGHVDVAQMQIVIPETFQSRIPQLNIVDDDTEKSSGFAERVALNIKVNAPNQIFVRGWGLDAEFGGNVEITGNAEAPQFNGTLSSRRGRFEEFGKRFTLARADLRFQGSIPPSPYLDIEATIPAGDVTASIMFTGPVRDPAINFSSSPALPEDEVLSRILFGKDTARISPFQTIQLAQAIQRFSGNGGGYGINPLGMLRSATGLDDVSLETDESGATSVGVGKYITDNVYLEIEKGGAEGSGAATIQIEVTPSINIESRIGQDAQGGAGILWKRDY